MNKSIIAVCAFALAVVSQAATVKWTCQGVTEYGSSTLAGSTYSAFFVDSANIETVKGYLEAGEFGKISGAGQAAFVSSKEVGTGVGTGTITTTAGNPETYTGYLVIFDGNDIAKAEHAFLSAEASGTTGATEGQKGTVVFGTIAGTSDAKNWYAAPEPTSGLLLLLGVAGLALKRRRA